MLSAARPTAVPAMIHHGSPRRSSARQSAHIASSQKKMKSAFDPMKYYDPTFIENTVKRHPEWFKDLPKGS